MKKIFSLIFALTAVMALNATVLTRSVSQLVEDSAWTVSAGRNIGTIATNFDLDTVINISTTGTPNCGTFWGDGANIDWRLYQAKHGNVTISAKEGYLINAIRLTYSSLYTAVLLQEDSTTQYLSEDIYVLPEQSDSLTLIVGNTDPAVKKGQAQIKIFEIWYSAVGETPDLPDLPVVWVPDTISVSQALALIAEGDENSHYIHGVVYQAPFSPFNGCIAFWMHDEESRNDTIEAFKMKKDANTPFASVDEAQGLIHEGDKVLIFANGITNYTNKTTHATFAETTEGYYVETLESGLRVNMVFDTLYVNYNSRWEEAELRFHGIEGTSDVNVTSLIQNNITKFAGFYTLQDSIDFDEVMMPNIKYGETTLLGVTMKATYVSVADNVYTYFIVLLGQDVEGVPYEFRGELFIVCNDANFGKYDDGTLIPKYTVGRAIQEGQNGNTDVAMVYGYACQIDYQYNDLKSGGQRYANADFYLSDEPDTRAATNFEAYHCTPAELADSLVVLGQLYCIFGSLTKFYDKVEISAGTYRVVDKLPDDIAYPEIEPEPDTISAERAYQIGDELPNPELTKESITDKRYFIIGIVQEKSFGEYSTEYNNQTWLMANTEGYTGSMIQIYRAKPDAEDPAKVGDKMGVLSKIKKYHGKRDDGSEYFSISTEQGAAAVHTDLEIPDDADTAIPQILMDESVKRTIKTMDKGQIIIIKDGVKYNILGTRL